MTIQHRTRTRRRFRLKRLPGTHQNGLPRTRTWVARPVMRSAANEHTRDVTCTVARGRGAQGQHVSSKQVQRAVGCKGDPRARQVGPLPNPSACPAELPQELPHPQHPGNHLAADYRLGAPPLQGAHLQAGVPRAGMLAQSQNRIIGTFIGRHLAARESARAALGQGAHLHVKTCGSSRSCGGTPGNVAPTGGHGRGGPCRLRSWEHGGTHDMAC